MLNFCYRESLHLISTKLYEFKQNTQDLGWQRFLHKLTTPSKTFHFLSCLGFAQIPYCLILFEWMNWNMSCYISCKTGLSCTCYWVLYIDYFLYVQETHLNNLSLTSVGLRTLNYLLVYFFNMLFIFLVKQTTNCRYYSYSGLVLLNIHTPSIC